MSSSCLQPLAGVDDQVRPEVPGSLTRRHQLDSFASWPHPVYEELAYRGEAAWSRESWRLALSRL